MEGVSCCLSEDVVRITGVHMASSVHVDFVIEMTLYLMGSGERGGGEWKEGGRRRGGITWYLL